MGFTALAVKSSINFGFLTKNFTILLFCWHSAPEHPDRSGCSGAVTYDIYRRLAIAIVRDCLPLFSSSTLR